MIIVNNFKLWVPTIIIVDKFILMLLYRYTMDIYTSEFIMYITLISLISYFANELCNVYTTIIKNMAEEDLKFRMLIPSIISNIFNSMIMTLCIFDVISSIFNIGLLNIFWVIIIGSYMAIYNEYCPIDKVTLKEDDHENKL